ncbi:MAG: nucleotide exchange factor GrpE, partial [Syntrophomonadaceae bacterium]|nr:nucleotide exchange factor GrpE [Syntrophomonadaceae bacterium]
MLETLVEQGEGFKVMFRMLSAMNDRCPQVPGQPPEIMIQRADFNEALRVSFNPAASVEAAMAAAKEGYLEARAKNGATLSGLNEKLDNTLRQVRKFVQENVLPLKDALGEHLPSGDSSLGEAWAGLQAELGDYLSRIGVRTIPVACGQPFDPEVHEPLAVSPGDGEEGDVVAKVILPGYEIHLDGLRTGHLVVRRAMVEVRTSGKVKNVES